MTAQREMVVTARASRFLILCTWRWCLLLPNGLRTIHRYFVLSALLHQAYFFRTYGRLLFVAAPLRTGGLLELVVANRVSKVGYNHSTWFKHKSRLDKLTPLMAKDLDFMATLGPHIFNLLVTLKHPEGIQER